MTAFEFVFPLFGLLVGLSYTEMLGGLARALKALGHVRIGWLVPLMGILILINLTMFWYGSWQLRHMAVPTSASLLLILLVGGTYYLAAALVFPNAEDRITDLDDHFLKVRRTALLAIAFCNVLGLASVASNAGWSMRPVWWAVNGLFLLLLLFAATINNKRLIGASLALMIGFHALGVAMSR
jgi:hypothetical protein